MSFQSTEVNQSFSGDSGQQLKGSLLADSSLSDFNVARTAMTSQAVPGAFGDLAIDFGSGSDQPGSLVQMAAAGEEVSVKGPNVHAHTPPGGPGMDCAPGTITPTPGGGRTVVITPGPNGCDVGPHTFKGTNDGRVIVEPNPRYVPDEDE